jgi:hypothetical protein
VSWNNFDFSSLGGVARRSDHLSHIRLGLGELGAAPDGEPVWDFGWAAPPLGSAPLGRSFHAVAPHLAGSWDGKTSFSLWEVGKKVTGSYLEAQYQTLGTCVSRGWSASCNLLQLAMIAQGVTRPDGRPLEFKRIAHAPIYGGSRAVGGFLAPPGRDGSNGSWAAEWVQKGGVCTLEDIGDRYDSDTKAGQMGWKGVPADVKEVCRQHLVSDCVMVTSFQEAADAIVNGHPVAVCSDQGFTMRRDADGFDRPYGSWAHCMHFGSVIVTAGGRRGLGCGQSWGASNPSGPLLPGAPGHVFGVDEATVNRMLRAQDSFTVAGINGWAAASWPLDWVLWS